MIGKRSLLLACLLPLAALAAGEEEGFVPLFNGKDLTGWVAVNNAPDTFTARDGMIVTTGVPTGVMRTQKQYENFILELEWKHLKPKGNSGVFVWSDPIPAVGVPFTRAIEVQVLDGTESKDYTSDGDVFSIWGATLVPDRPHPSGWQRCLPSEKRSKPAGQWNHYRVECNDGVLKLAVNGKVVSGGSKCRPRKGYLCLEAEGSECHFRNLRIKELPSTNPAPEEVCDTAKAFVTLFTGVDLAGWKADPGQQDHWQPRPGPNTLVFDGKSEAKGKGLWTEKEYGDFEMICDWRWTPAKGVEETPECGIALRGSTKSQVHVPKAKAVNPAGKWNRFLITLRGDRLTVRLNGQVVIDDDALPGIPRKGPIGLVDHGTPVEFTNLFVRELE
jgi:hypothetical protein